MRQRQEQRRNRLSRLPCRPGAGSGVDGEIRSLVPVRYARSTNGNRRPGQFAGHLLEKNVTLRGYTLQSSFQHVPLALKDLFAWVADGSLKIDVTRYPLRDAAKAQDDFAARKTTGKIVLKPFE
jgi:NADPH:quinone reductase-like Zn-dependent oxidoreductase